MPSWFDIARYAQEAGAKWPELVAAQFVLESGWGKHVSGKNNYFGIKGKGTKKQTTEFVNGKQVTIVDEFKDYASARDCVNDLVVKWYKDYQDYKGVNSATSRDEAARMLVQQGYATDPQYADKLIKIMNSNSVPQVMTATRNDISLIDAAEHFNSEKHQIDAFQYLQQNTSKTVLDEFAKRYRSKQVAKPKFPLDVPYYYQRDSKTGHGERSCQASAIAMAIEYINPSLIYDDDDYLKTVLRYGDTVSQAAHQKALDSLGIKHAFRMDGKESDIIRILDKGYPVPIGILHRGSLASPSGGGHYITVVGYDEKYFYVHDPFGELDLVAGSYPRTGPNDGKNQRYTRANLMKRWLIASNNDGWYWDLSDNKILR